MLKGGDGLLVLHVICLRFSWFSLKTRVNVKYCSQVAGRNKAEKEEKRAR
jgi:hypothetical protein